MTVGSSSDGPLAGARCATRLPAQDLDRARAWYRDKLGLEPVEEREGGLLYRTEAGDFALFASTGASEGEFTQMGFEVDDIHAAIAALKERGVVFEEFSAPGFEMIDSVVDVGGNYPSKGRSELGSWFRDSEGNMLSLGQPVR